MYSRALLILERVALVAIRIVWRRKSTIRFPSDTIVNCAVYEIFCEGMTHIMGYMPMLLGWVYVRYLLPIRTEAPLL